MDAITIGELADVLGTERTGLDVASSFGSVSIDSRTLKPGEVFWAIPGHQFDGHSFLADVESAGAKAAVVSRDCETSLNCLQVADVTESLRQFSAWYRSMLLGTIVGVTGSVGKTTCRRMIHDVLSSRYSVTQSPKNFNNHFGVPLSLLSASGGDDYVILELGASGRGEIRDNAQLSAPEIGVVTAIAPAHLEGFGTLADIKAAKGELVESLPSFGLALLNGDDASVRSLASRADCEVVFFGTTSDCDVRPTSVLATADELRFEVDGFEYFLNVAGEHHLYSALAAIGVGRAAGLLPNEIQEGFAAFRPANGRCEVLRFGDSVVIDDTYNASPNSVVAAARALGQFTDSGQRILVLGDMAELGPDAESLHLETGKNCARSADIDVLLAVGLFAPQFVAGAGSANVEATVANDLDALIAQLANRFKPGDAVLVKGSRSARMERVVRALADRLTVASNA